MQIKSHQAGDQRQQGDRHSVPERVGHEKESRPGGAARAAAESRAAFQ
jgi:hypothetical protein